MNQKNGIPTDPGYCGGHEINTGPHDPMWPACKPHDEAYTAHEKGAGGSRREADNRLLDDMVAIVDAEDENYWRKVRLTWQAAIYATIVGAVGWIWWDYF